jgi:FdhE protein
MLSAAMECTVADDDDPTSCSRMTRALPDLTPWLSLLWQSRREAAAVDWTGAADGSDPAMRTALALRAPDDRHCLLAETAVAVVPSAVARLAYRLLGAGGTGLRTKLRPDLAVALLTAAVEQDDDALAGLALELDVESQRLAAIAPFLAMPLLLACGRAWAAEIPVGWAHGHCPVCAAWPALAERRGLAGGRWLRCSRCGVEWRQSGARCPFCECDDPDQLAALTVAAAADRNAVPGRNASRDRNAVPGLAASAERNGATDRPRASDRHVEACRQCRGYVKALATGAPIPPGDVAVRDLLTLDLDLAALDAGFVRPAVRVPRFDAAPASPRHARLVAPLAGG